MGIFSKISGLDKLARKYAVNSVQPGVEYRKQTIQIGNVRYRSCVTVKVSSSGLYLSIDFPLSKTFSLKIPWEEMSGWHPARLYGRKAFQMAICNPPIAKITVYESLFKQLKSFLAK